MSRIIRSAAGVEAELAQRLPRQRECNVVADAADLEHCLRTTVRRRNLDHAPHLWPNLPEAA